MSTFTEGSWGLFGRSLGWGVATGAATGGLAGFIIGVLTVFGRSPPAVPLAYGALGAFFGALVALVPSVVGGLVVTVVIEGRHPKPAAAEAVEHDLTVLFGAVVGALHALAVGVALAYGASLLEIARALPYVGYLDLCVAVMLRWARASLTRAWSGAAP